MVGPLFPPVWKKHGDREPHECVPLWRFEGIGVHSNVMITTSEWRSATKTGFMAIETDLAGGTAFVNWNIDGAGVQRGYNKCMSGGTIRRIQVHIIENTMPHEFNLAIWKDEFKEDQKFMIIPPASIFEPNNQTVNMFHPLVFDHSYGYGFTTTDGTIPNFEDATQTMTGWITTEFFYGAGDPS